MHYPLDSKIQTLVDVPYTISFVIRKRMQLDNINEVPKERRPSDDLIWNGSSEELDKWFNDMSKNNDTNSELVITTDDIER